MAKVTRRPLDLAWALEVFGKLKNEHPEFAEQARLGMKLVRVVQHLHKTIAYARTGLPPRHKDHIDPLRLDKALAKTTQSKWGAAQGEGTR